MARSKPDAKKAGSMLSALEERFAAFKPAAKVLTDVVAVPTRFVQVDHATRIGGWPIQRAGIIHGRSNEGKSAFALGLCGSFVEADGLADYVDAEFTTTAEWTKMLLGEKVANSPLFKARRPASYEKCVDETRELHRLVRDARKAKELPAHGSMITVVDSLRKLVPEDILAKIRKSGASGDKGSVDGMGGRAAQIRAAMNAAWLDELIPLLDECRTAWVAIARESEDPDADVWDKKFGNDYKVQGGKAVVYDAALRIRITRGEWTSVPKPGDSSKKLVVGERHKVEILKTKVGGKEGRATVAFFHTSLGMISPEGFDRPRDVAQLAERFGLVTVDDGGVHYAGEKWKSREKFIAALHEADGERETLEAKCRARFNEEAPEEAEAAPAMVEFPSAAEEGTP